MRGKGGWRVGLCPWFWLLAFAGLVVEASGQRATKPDVIIKPEQEEFMKQAQEAVRMGKREDALKLATRAVSADPTNYVGYAFRARLHDHLKNHAAAVVDYSMAYGVAPMHLEFLQSRAMSQFRAGRLPDAIHDWETYLKLEPDVSRDPYLFTLGIAYAIAGKHDAGRKRFAWYNTVVGDDVEAAAWHFLCAAKGAAGSAGALVRAREGLLPVAKDKRLPMAQIYELLKGTLGPANVLAAARAGEIAPAVLQQRLFYAHLYLGVYYDAAGQPAMARLNLRRAAEGTGELGADPTLGFMGDVARVYADSLDAAQARDLAAAIASSSEHQKLRSVQRIAWAVLSLLVVAGVVRIARRRAPLPAGNAPVNADGGPDQSGDGSVPRPAVAAALAAEKIST